MPEISLTGDVRKRASETAARIAEIAQQLLTASNVTGNACSLTTVIALDGSHAKSGNHAERSRGHRDESSDGNSYRGDEKCRNRTRFTHWPLSFSCQEFFPDAR
jgi:hypothetical protein